MASRCPRAMARRIVFSEHELRTAASRTVIRTSTLLALAWGFGCILGFLLTIGHDSVGRFLSGLPRKKTCKSDDRIVDHLDGRLIHQERAGAACHAVTMPVTASVSYSVNCRDFRSYVVNKLPTGTCGRSSFNFFSSAESSWGGTGSISLNTSQTNAMTLSAAGFDPLVKPLPMRGR